MDKVQKALQTKFKKNNRLTAKALKKYNQFDCLAIIIGSQHTVNQGIQKQFQQWYLGSEISDSIIIISPKRLFVLSNEIMFDKLNHLLGTNTKQFNILFLIREMNRNNNQQFQLILEILRKENSSTTFRIGLNLQDGQKSPLIAQFLNFLDQNLILKLDGTSFIKELINQENKDIFQNYLICGRVNKYYMSLMFQRIQQSIEMNENTTNFQISQAVKREKSQELNQMAIKRKFGLTSDYEILSAVVQSGGRYNANAEESANERLIGDVIIVSFCCQYGTSQTYCSRTLIFQPSDELEQMYRAILNVQTFAIGLVKEQIQFRQIYKETQYLWDQIYKDDPLFKNKFPSDLGYILNSHLLIDANNTEYVQTKMLVVIRMHVSNISVQIPLYPELFNISICLADSIYVTADVEDCIVTKLEKDFSSISYQRDREGEGLTKQTFQKDENLDANQLAEKQTREQFEQAEMNKINKDQEKLKEIKHYELEVRLNDQQTQQKPKLLIKMDELQIKQNEEESQQFPLGEIAVDQQNSAILIPIRGTHYYFHALTIQNISVKQISEDKARMQIRFWTNEFNVDSRVYPLLERGQIFLKEITLENPSIIRLKEIENEINICRDDAREKQLEKQLEVDKFDFVIEKLKELPKNTPNLTNLFMRPTQNSKAKSSAGFLECHENGFRYQSARREVIDFTFTNVKHSFFVSPEDEVIACLHFEFKVPIKSGKQQYTQIQFYREIEGASEQEAARKKSRFCEIDVNFDQKVQRRRKEEFQNFNNFIQQSEQYFKRFNLKFETLEKQYSFEGNYSKERLVFQPTLSCLVNIVDSPFFVLTLENVDVVCFERVQAGTISFDFIAVLKDLEAPVIRIEAVELTDLKRIQEWLNKKKILFFSTSTPIIWRNVQFSIQKDFPLFVYDGGWATIMKDYMDHANTQQFINDPLFEPDSSIGPTSVSEFEFEQDKKNNKYLHSQKDEENDFSDLVDSEDIMSELDIQEKRQKKKIKYNYID